jgi:hypothetical protein
MEETGEKPDGSMPQLNWYRIPGVLAVLTPLLLLIGVLPALAAFRNHAQQATSGLSFVTWLWTIGAALPVAAGLACGLRASVIFRRMQQDRLAALRAGSLPERAEHAAEVLQEATTLVQDLQAELAARTALLEEVKRRAAETSRRVEDLERLSHVDDETTRAFNNLLDEALKRRLEDLERGARQREWFIGTVVAVVVGVVAILVSHFVLGF